MVGWRYETKKWVEHGVLVKSGGKTEEWAGHDFLVEYGGGDNGLDMVSMGETYLVTNT